VRCRTHRSRIALLASIAALCTLHSSVAAIVCDDRLSLQNYQDAQIESARISIGDYRVYENRAAQDGREIHLNIVILHALAAEPKPDPVFILHGGPGVAAAGAWRGHRRSSMRRDRDLVFISQRGTDGDNRLDIDLPGGDHNIQGYLESAFDIAIYERGLAALKERFDLTQYSTCAAADDLNDIREALGYQQVNLVGGSYGTRMALVYMRQHAETVRCAILTGVAPLAFTNPLYHAQSAQEGLEKILHECETDPRYSGIYSDLRNELHEVLARLEEKPAEATIAHPLTGEPTTVRLSRSAFTGALRVMMYYMGTNRSVPYAIHRAHEGDFTVFAETAVRSVRGLHEAIAFGMLMCVTAAEDIARIDPETIDELTKDTIFGDDRVRQQMAIAAIWPKSDLPPDFGEPVSVDIPVLLFSGTHDPVTPPRWGEEAARHLPNSLHITIPAAHDAGGRCVESIQKQFLESADLENLDTRCVESMTLPPLVLPDARGDG